MVCLAQTPSSCRPGNIQKEDVSLWMIWAANDHEEWTGQNVRLVYGRSCVDFNYQINFLIK